MDMDIGASSGITYDAGPRRWTSFATTFARGHGQHQPLRTLPRTHDCGRYQSCKSHHWTHRTHGHGHGHYRSGHRSWTQLVAPHQNMDGSSALLFTSCTLPKSRLIIIADDCPCHCLAMQLRYPGRRPCPSMSLYSVSSAYAYFDTLAGVMSKAIGSLCVKSIAVSPPYVTIVDVDLSLRRRSRSTASWPFVLDRRSSCRKESASTAIVGMVRERPSEALRWSLARFSSPSFASLLNKSAIAGHRRGHPCPLDRPVHYRHYRGPSSSSWLCSIVVQVCRCRPAVRRHRRLCSPPKSSPSPITFIMVFHHGRRHCQSASSSSISVITADRRCPYGPLRSPS